ncbi:unnamed protein product [Withania somnifera]
MTSVDAKLLLDRVILDYMFNRGFHQTAEAFSNEIRSSENRVAINSHHEAFLQAWWGKFYEAYKSRFPDDAVLTADSFDKVVQTLKDVVASNNLHQSYASSHTEANICSAMPVMSSPHLMTSSPMMESNVPDLLDAKISDLLSSFDTEYMLLDSSFQSDMASFPKMGEMEGMLPLASISSYQMQQTATVPPKWNARDDRPGINLGGPTLMDPSIHAPANALPASLEFLESGNDGSLQQASHQGWPSVMLGDTDQRNPEHLQQIIAPTGGIMISSEKLAAAEQEKINQLGLQSSNKSGIKRKTPMSSLASVSEEKAIVAGVHFSQGSVGLLSASNSTHALRNFLLRLHMLKINRKVLIWEPENRRFCIGKGHDHHVTDVRFRPNSTVFATSSFDRTVKIWDAAKQSNPIKDLVGHGEHVMSIDFHPTKLDLLSSCDSNDEIRLWDVNRGDCKLSFKGGIRQVRYQPQLGDYLASSTGNIINIFDVETNSIQKKLLGHVKDILSICWDISGNYLASVSEDSARIWSVSDRKCIHELYSSGNKFQSCAFHPGHAHVLVIGSDKFLELWNPFFQSNTTSSYSAHCGIISSLADSPSKRAIASVSHDQWIKIWR